MSVVGFVRKRGDVRTFRRRSDGRYFAIAGLSHDEAKAAAKKAFREYDETPAWCRHTPIGHVQHGCRVVAINYELRQVTWEKDGARWVQSC